MNRTKQLFKAKPWKFTPEIKEIFSTEHIQNLLTSFNRLNDGSGVFFMLDNTDDRLIVDEFIINANGLSKTYMENAKTENNLLSKIMKPKEYESYYRIRNQASDIFLNTPIEHREGMVVTCFSVSRNSPVADTVFEVKKKPFLLDLNGNMWLELIYISAYPTYKPIAYKAHINNSATGEQYNFVDNTFVLTNKNDIHLSREEVQILKWLSQGMTIERMCDFLLISVSSFKRKKKKIYDKFNVQTSTEAIYKAGSMGII
ncbi:MAG: LuxR C-terminal-related transcriptional regulator [Bacteroidales bacterium]|nr:LuxR C-terminal-related transcriptional regulator [Bacteroidales bacterium]